MSKQKISLIKAEPRGNHATKQPWSEIEISRMLNLVELDCTFLYLVFELLYM